MFLMKKSLFLMSVFFLFLVSVSVFAQEKATVHFFKTETCSHCVAEDVFLAGLEEKYSNLEVLRYFINSSQDRELLKELAEKYGAQRYVGVVPITFVGDDFFVGFDNAEGIGLQIEESIQKQIKGLKSEGDFMRLPILGNIDTSGYSFFSLSVILGFLDGFNVCSLAALVLILGLVLVLKSRRKIMLFGGVFIFTTAVVYGLLIVLWYQLFSYLAQYIRILEILVGILAVSGSAFFFRQFVRFRKYGPSCSASAGGSLISRFFRKIQEIFEKSNSTLVLLGGVFLFALVVAIIEFPCSAAIPVVFAGALAKAQLSSASSLFYITLFVLFYMLDELVVFLVAVFKMNIWLASPKFTIWVTLMEAIILALLGFYYLVGLF